MDRPAKGRQRGYLLVTGMIFMLILAVIGVNAMQTTNLDYRMSTNSALKKQAFERGESGRSALASVLAQHLSQGGVWSSMTLPAGLDIYDKDSDSSDDSLAVNGVSELQDSPLDDAVFSVDLDGDGNVTDENEFEVTVSVFNMKTINAPGNGAGQFGGTLGLGKGGGAGGTHMFLQIRSEGTAAGDARSNVVVDYRHVNK